MQLDPVVAKSVSDSVVLLTQRVYKGWSNHSLSSLLFWIIFFTFSFFDLFICCEFPLIFLIFTINVCKSRYFTFFSKFTEE